MAGIIIFLILAIGYALCGDTSGIEAIGKVILGIALFIGVGCIIVYAPWLILVVIVGIIFWAIISSKGNKGNSSNNTNYSLSHNYNDYQHQSKDNAKTFIDNSNQTDFQRQLQENTKTPQQVKNEQKSKEMEEAKQSAKYDYNKIKKELLQQAERGNYSIENGHKNIFFDHKYRWQPSFIGRKAEAVYINKTFLNPSGEYATKLSVFITEQTYYNAYISEIKRLCLIDGISIIPLMVNRNNSYDTRTLPFTVQGFGIYESSYEFVLRCSVQY